ncbi:unnamed protein product [Rotaria sordida]|uniref:Uncharacterized protein n=1 Tax=Rotaria sordida TaxID=392033 RepID=A0A815T3Y0_9BILA|nr:unnamed protein product [Rotaria sordida]
MSLFSLTTLITILGIYTAITTVQEGTVADERRQFDLEQAAKFRQQTIYDKFLDDIYKLEKDGYLNEEKNPWAFANARFRAAHRQWDAIRKADILQFLKENQLIVRKPSIKNRAVKKVDNIIHLNDLNFDNISLTSPTGSLNSLNLEYIVFDQISMINARFSFVNLRETSFSHSRLNNVKFSDSSLAYASFNSTELDGTDFGNTNMIGVEFSNIDLCTTILTEIQLQQIVFTNSILPNSSICRQEKTTSTPSMITISTTEELSTSQSTPTALCPAANTLNSKEALTITFGSGATQYSSATPAAFGFTTTYQQIFNGLNGIVNNGQFAFVTTVSPVASSWHQDTVDHTPNDDTTTTHGYMMFVNAKETPDDVFRMTINNLCIGSRYEFSVYLANIAKKGTNLTPPNIKFEVQTATTPNTLLGTVATGDIPAYATLAWSNYGMSFIAMTSSVILSMISNASGGGGNDLIVDDITLRVCSPTANAICNP